MIYRKNYIKGIINEYYSIIFLIIRNYIWLLIILNIY